jgi:hypothetical protein
VVVCELDFQDARAEGFNHGPHLAATETSVGKIF